MSKWIGVIFGMIPKKEMSRIIVGVLRDLAKKTENKLDDKAVDIIEVVLESAFK